MCVCEMTTTMCDAMDACAAAAAAEDAAARVRARAKLRRSRGTAASLGTDTLGSTIGSRVTSASSRGYGTSRGGSPERATSPNRASTAGLASLVTGGGARPWSAATSRPASGHSARSCYGSVTAGGPRVTATSLLGDIWEEGSGMGEREEWGVGWGEEEGEATGIPRSRALRGRPLGWGAGAVHPGPKLACTAAGSTAVGTSLLDVGMGNPTDHLSHFSHFTKGLSHLSHLHLPHTTMGKYPLPEGMAALLNPHATAASPSPPTLFLPASLQKCAPCAGAGLDYVTAAGGLSQPSQQRDGGGMPELAAFWAALG